MGEFGRSALQTRDNSLASLVGLLRLQGRNAQSEEVQNALKDADSRITTIAQVHDHLWRSTRIGFLDIADFAGELCRKLQETVAHRIVMISADKAIPLGLLINVIVTNSAKHAYPDGSGEILVSGERRGSDLHVEVSDRGIGLPKDFDIDQPRGEPWLQGYQEPARSTRRTHCGGLQHAERCDHRT